MLYMPYVPCLLLSSPAANKVDLISVYDDHLLVTVEEVGLIF